MQGQVEFIHGHILAYSFRIRAQVKQRIIIVGMCI